MKLDLTPSQFVRLLFGGHKAVAEIVGVGPDVPRQWKGVPIKHFKALIAAAAAQGHELTTDMLVFGVTLRVSAMSPDAERSEAMAAE